MPDPKLRPIPDVPMGIDKKTWDFLNVIKHNLNILAGSKGTQDNKGVTFEDLNSEIANIPDTEMSDVSGLYDFSLSETTCLPDARKEVSAGLYDLPVNLEERLRNIEKRNAYENPYSSYKILDDFAKDIISLGIVPSLFRTIEPKQYIPCTSLTLTKGTPVGTVADMQVVLDGNLYQVAETAGVPGLDLSVFIAEVPDFGGLVISAYYIGATSGIGGDINGDWLAPVHYIAVQLYNNSTAAWDSIIYIPDSRALNYRHIELPRDRTINYINAANRVDIRFYHPVTGNINHDLYIDYVAVVRNLK